MKTVRLRTEAEFSSERFVSRLLHDSPQARVVLFCLDPRQEVTPHTSTSEVIFVTISGKGTIQVGAETEKVGGGMVVVCPSGELHGIKAAVRMQVLAIIAPSPL